MERLDSSSCPRSKETMARIDTGVKRILALMQVSGMWSEQCAEVGHGDGRWSGALKYDDSDGDCSPVHVQAQVPTECRNT